MMEITLFAKKKHKKKIETKKSSDGTAQSYL